MNNQAMQEAETLSDDEMDALLSSCRLEVPRHLKAGLLVEARDLKRLTFHLRQERQVSSEPANVFIPNKMTK